MGPPWPSFVFGDSTAFFHVIGRGASALEKGVIVTIMDHIRIANNYRCEHVLIVSLRMSRMLIMRHKQAFCGGIFSNFASPE